MTYTIVKKIIQAPQNAKFQQENQKVTQTDQRNH